MNAYALLYSFLIGFSTTLWQTQIQVPKYDAIQGSNIRIDGGNQFRSKRCFHSLGGCQQLVKNAFKRWVVLVFVLLDQIEVSTVSLSKR